MRPINLPGFMAALEIRYIEKALRATGNNCAQAADLLALNRTTLVEKRKSYGLPIAKPGGRWKKKRRVCN